MSPLSFRKTIGATDAPVRLWFIEPATLRQSTAGRQCSEWLDEMERARARRFHFDDDRETFIAAHVLLRGALSTYGGFAPEAWHFETAHHGKPCLADPLAGKPLKFNLAHTRGCAVAATAQGIELGVDVESCRRAESTQELRRLSKRFFSAQESEWLAHLPKEIQRERFFHLWCLKEAYLKVRGVGLALPLNSFSLSFDPSNCIRLVASADPAANRLRFALWTTTNNFVAAVCAETTVLTVECLRFDPSGAHQPMPLMPLAASPGTHWA
jgi:4'-phosphopantetheinyl transferase